jgi:DNA-binding transcriptional ArsR family regulator
VTRILAESALEHPNRAALYAMVRQEPGIGFRELVARVGMASGTAHHHLAVLQRGGILRSERVGGGVAFLFAGDLRNAAHLSVLREPGMTQLYDLIRSRGRICQGAVLEVSSQWPKSTVQHRLQRLVAAGLVRSTWQGRFRFYEVA